MNMLHGNFVPKSPTAGLRCMGNSV